MTLAKTCHASNMTQDLEKATCRPVATTNAFGREIDSESSNNWNAWQSAAWWLPAVNGWKQRSNLSPFVD